MKISFAGDKYFLYVNRFFKKLPWILGRHAFWVIIVLAILSVLLGGFLFYNYVIVPEEQLADGKINFGFMEGAYQRVLNQWELTNKEFERWQGAGNLSPFNERQ